MKGLENNKRILGIDYGSKRIGIAMTDETGGYALPHSVVQNSNEAIDEIIKICTENNVSKIVVGESKDFSGQDNLIMIEIKKFAGKLKKKSGIDIIFHPEFLTSAQAERSPLGSMKPKARLMRKKKKNRMLDASAATIILQSYVDKHYIK